MIHIVILGILLYDLSNDSITKKPMDNTEMAVKMGVSRLGGRENSIALWIIEKIITNSEKREEYSAVEMQF